MSLRRWATFPFHLMLFAVFFSPGSQAVYWVCDIKPGYSGPDGKVYFDELAAGALIRCQDECKAPHMRYGSVSICRRMEGSQLAVAKKPKWLSNEAWDSLTACQKSCVQECEPKRSQGTGRWERCIDNCFARCGEPISVQ